MIKKIEVKTTKIEHHTFCDDCEKESFISSRCEMCGKDLCNNCYGHVNDTLGDYPEVYCKACWTIGEKYRTKIIELKVEINKLEKEWREEGREKFKNT